MTDKVFKKEKNGLNRREFNLMAAATAVSMTHPLKAFADETCQSPYMPKITGHEEYVYVWTLGVEKMGDGQDKLVTIDLRKNIDSLILAQYLDKYAETGDQYTETLEKIIKQNNLMDFDQAKLLPTKLVISNNI